MKLATPLKKWVSISRKSKKKNGMRVLVMAVWVDSRPVTWTLWHACNFRAMATAFALIMESFIRLSKTVINASNVTTGSGMAIPGKFSAGIRYIPSVFTVARRDTKTQVDGSITAGWTET